MSFPNEDRTTGGKDGADITLTQAQSKQTYMDNGWHFRDSFLGPWEINDGAGFPFFDLQPMAWDYFPSEDRTTGGKDGADKYNFELLDVQTYADNGWDISKTPPGDTVWAIVNGRTWPFLTWEGYPTLSISLGDAGILPLVLLRSGDAAYILPESFALRLSLGSWDNIAHPDLVPVDDPDASPLRISIGGTIYAFRRG